VRVERVVVAADRRRRVPSYGAFMVASERETLHYKVELALRRKVKGNRRSVETVATRRAPAAIR